MLLDAHIISDVMSLLYEKSWIGIYPVRAMEYTLWHIYYIV